MSPLPGEVRKIPARKSVLSSQLALLDRFFLNDDLQMRGHIPVQPNRNGELAQRLERFVELDLTTIQIEAFLRERLGDVIGHDHSDERMVDYRTVCDVIVVITSHMRV